MTCSLRPISVVYRVVRIWVVEGGMAQGLHLLKSFLQNARKSADHSAPLTNVSTQKMVVYAMEDVIGYEGLRRAAAYCSSRSSGEDSVEKDAPYRPCTLRRVAVDLDFSDQAREDAIG